MQLAQETTRNQNILDLVITTPPDIIDSLVVGDYFSDHSSLSFKILSSPYAQRKSHKLFYSYSKTDWVHRKSLLSYIPWQCAFLDDVIDYNWTCCKDLLFTAMDECIPIRLCGKKKIIIQQSAEKHQPCPLGEVLKTKQCSQKRM